jgi:hypothetical protein
MIQIHADRVAPEKAVFRPALPRVPTAGLLPEKVMKDWKEEFSRQAEHPVDEELFLYCQHVYAAAAHLSMPVENPAYRPLIEDKGKTYALADIPINRGMLAVLKELRGRDEMTRQAIMLRLMHVGEIFGQEKLKKFFQESKEPGAVMVSEALLRACATARFIFEGDYTRFDIDDLARIAQKLTDEEEKNP